MEPKITFRSIERSQDLETLAVKKLHILDKFLLQHNPHTVELIFQAHKVHKQFILELRIQTGKIHLVAKKEGEDIFALLDNVINTMSGEFLKAKEKQLDAHHGK